MRKGVREKEEDRKVGVFLSESALSIRLYGSLPLNLLQ